MELLGHSWPAEEPHLAKATPTEHSPHLSLWFTLYSMLYYKSRLPGTISSCPSGYHQWPKHSAAFQYPTMSLCSGPNKDMGSDNSQRRYPCRRKSETRMRDTSSQPKLLV